MASNETFKYITFLENEREKMQNYVKDLSLQIHSLKVLYFTIITTITYLIILYCVNIVLYVIVIVVLYYIGSKCCIITIEMMESYYLKLYSYIMYDKQSCIYFLSYNCKIIYKSNYIKSNQIKITLNILYRYSYRTSKTNKK